MASHDHKCTCVDVMVSMVENQLVTEQQQQQSVPSEAVISPVIDQDNVQFSQQSSSSINTDQFRSF